MNSDMSISKRLQGLRKSHQFTMKEVAEKIGVPVSTYRDWEYGSSIKGEPYLRLAKVFEVSLLFLLTGQEPPKGDEIIERIKKIQLELNELIHYSLLRT